MEMSVRLGLLALALASAAPAHAASGLTDRLEARAIRWRAAMDSLGVPGLAVAAVRGDSVVWTGTWGLRDVERQLPVTPRTMFYIASCTKTFVATLATDLAARGKLDLDAPLRKLEPRFRLADSAATDTLTMRDLLCHRAGLRQPAIGFGEAYSGQMTEERYWRLLARARPLGRTSYSNLNYTLAARVIGARMGGTWQELLESRLFGPAGMTRTTCSASRWMADPDAAIPYERSAHGVVPSSVRKTDRTMHPAGGMVSTLEDLSRWVRLHLADGVIDGRRVLAPGVTESMRVMQAPAPDRHPLSPDHTRAGYGLGWELRDYRGTRMAAHNGNYAGAGAVLALLPETGAGVVVLANGTAGVALCEAIAMEVEDALLAREPQDVTARLIEIGPRMFPPPAPDTSSGRLLGTAASSAGTFANDDWGTLELSVRGDSLVGRMGALTMPIHLTGDDRFRAGADYSGRFERDARRRVRAIIMNVDPDTARFERR